MSKINVEGSEISIIAIDNRDYISLTDMVRNVENGVALIEKWLRNKNTIEFLGIWEEMYNANFNSTEFEGIKNEAGFNRFFYRLNNGSIRRILSELSPKQEDMVEHMHIKT